MGTPAETGQKEGANYQNLPFADLHQMSEILRTKISLAKKTLANSEENGTFVFELCSISFCDENLTLKDEQGKEIARLDPSESVYFLAAASGVLLGNGMDPKHFEVNEKGLEKSTIFPCIDSSIVYEQVVGLKEISGKKIPSKVTWNIKSKAC